MDIISASANAFLECRARAVSSTFPGAGKRLTAIATVGGNAAVSYPAADVGYVVGITADDDGDVATVDLSDGSRTQTTGSPVFEPASEIDFSGAALPEMDKLYAIRVTADSGNTAAVGVVGFPIASLAELSVVPGHVLLESYNQTGVGILTAEDLVFTFGTAGDSVTVEILARATPA